MVEKDLYRVLGVPPGAPPSAVRTAYRRSVLRFHPDLYRGDPEVANANLRELREAYDTLRDPSRRRAYDRSRGEGKPARADGPRRPRRGPGTGTGLWNDRARPVPARGATMRQAAGGGPAIDAWLLREWYASARTPPRRLFLRSSEMPRWMRGIFYVVLPSIVLFAVALLTVPVTERFSFSEGNGICQASHVEAFATGDQVAFSWATHPWTWRGATPVQLDLIAPGGSTQFSSLLFNGSFAFDAVAGGYTFLANGCAQGSVDVQGTSRGPVV